MVDYDTLVGALLDTLVQVANSVPFNNAGAIQYLRDILQLDETGYAEAVWNSVYGELDPSDYQTLSRYKVLSMAAGIEASGGNGYTYHDMVKSVGCICLLTRTRWS
jgi:hypothetical protein